MENLIKSHVSSLSCLQHHFVCVRYCLLLVALSQFYISFKNMYVVCETSTRIMTNNCMSKTIHPRNVYLGDRHYCTVHVVQLSVETISLGIRVWGAYKMFYYIFSVLCSIQLGLLEWCWRQFSLFLCLNVYGLCGHYMPSTCTFYYEKEKEIAHSSWISSGCVCVCVCMLNKKIEKYLLNIIRIK